MAARRLISIRREVPEGARERYRTGWKELERAATDAGAHAWRFVSPAHSSRFLEFLEFASDRDPRGLATVSSAMAELERLAPGASEEWEESSSE